MSNLSKGYNEDDKLVLRITSKDTDAFDSRECYCIVNIDFWG